MDNERLQQDKCRIFWKENVYNNIYQWRFFTWMFFRKIRDNFFRFSRIWKKKTIQKKCFVAFTIAETSVEFVALTLHCPPSTVINFVYIYPAKIKILNKNIGNITKYIYCKKILNHIHNLQKLGCSSKKKGKKIIENLYIPYKPVKI